MFLSDITSTPITKFLQEGYQVAKQSALKSSQFPCLLLGLNPRANFIPGGCEIWRTRVKPEQLLGHVQNGHLNLRYGISYTRNEAGKLLTDYIPLLFYCLIYSITPTNHLRLRKPKGKFSFLLIFL